MTDTSIDDRQWERCDFRRPTRLNREQLRSLDVLHETFTRRLSAGIGGTVRTNTSAEIARVSQVTWADYVRTLPSYTFLATIAAPPLPGVMLIEMDTSVALALADRLLGGRGNMMPPRRPTELEVPPLRRLASTFTAALGDALGSFLDVRTIVQSVDFSPQFVAITAPANMVLVLTYNLVVPAAGISGDLTLTVPLQTLAPAMARLAATAAEEQIDPDGPVEPMQPLVWRLPLTVEARLNPTDVPAGMVAALTVGDVIVLDHRIGRPAIAAVDGTPLFTGHLGRRGRRFALSVDWHPFVDDGPTDVPGQHGMYGSRLPGLVHDGRFEEKHDA